MGWSGSRVAFDKYPVRTWRHRLATLGWDGLFLRNDMPLDFLLKLAGACQYSFHFLSSLSSLPDAL